MRQFQELLELLREMGVTHYEYGPLKVTFSQSVGVASSVPVVQDEPDEQPAPAIGYQHPSLKLFSWPDK